MNDIILGNITLFRLYYNVDVYGNVKTFRGWYIKITHSELS